MIRLGVFADEEATRPLPSKGSKKLSNMSTLSQFYQQWFLPVVLVGERNCRQTTLLQYQQALGWWRQLTGDPPLQAIDEFTLAKFQTGLREATFQRKPGEDAQRYPLKKASQHKHLRNVRALLYRIGPTLDVNRPAKELVETSPYVRLTTVRHSPKRCFTWQQVESIIAATAINATSRAPAAAIAPRAPTQQRTVYEYIATHGPVTRDQIGEALGLTKNSVGPRVCELFEAGLVRAIDGAGITRSGSSAERLTRTAKPYDDDEPAPAIPVPAITSPKIPGMTPQTWWRGWIAAHFYTGLRSGTIAGLTWEHVQVDQAGQHWIHVPAELVTKTRKATRVIVHPQLLAALQAMRLTDFPAEPLVFQPFDHRCTSRWHEQLQLAAGIPAAECLSPHAWRRTHADQLAHQGMAGIGDMVRSALDHSDVRTTTRHYVDILSKLLIRLPNLW